MPDQLELDRVWNNIKQGLYEDGRVSVRPMAVLDDGTWQVMQIPSADRLGAHEYRRHPGGRWEEKRPGPPSPYR